MREARCRRARAARLPAQARLARRAFQDQLLEKTGGLFLLVEQSCGVEQLQPHALHRRLDLAVRRHVADPRQDALPFAAQRLELWRDGGDDIGGGATRPALGERAAQDDLGARAPVIHLDAVAPFERFDQLIGVFGRERGVEEKRPLLLRALDEALLAIRGRIVCELRQRLRVRWLQNEQPDGKNINRGQVRNYFVSHLTEPFEIITNLSPIHWALRFTITSSKDLSHLSCSSMAAAGSISLKRRCASGEGRLARV